MAKVWKRHDRNCWVVDFFDANGRRHRLFRKTREQAEDLLATKIKESRDAPLPMEDSTITLGEFGQRWLQSLEGEVARSTLVGYRGYFKLHIAPALGNVRLRDVTRAHVKRLLEAKRTSMSGKGQRPLSRRMIGLIRTTLSQLFAYAVDEGAVRVNPALAVLRQRGRRVAATVAAEEETVRPFSEEEVASLFNAARDHDQRTLILFLVRTGVRPGEAYGLRWDDIDFTKREALIERSVSNGRLGPTKTGRSRPVDLSKDVVAALKVLHAQRERWALTHRSEVPESVFLNPAGAVLDSAVVHKQFRLLMKRAKISGHVLYDLRHTFASRHLELGSPLTYVAKQLGHAKPTTTLKYYSHWLPRADKSFADRLDAAARPAGEAAVSAA